MLKRLVLATALAASPLAFAQQNVDISGANLSSGKADATLAALGRKAAESGNLLVITAPPEWHAKIAAKIHAGGNANVVMRDGFYENVLVRVEPKATVAAEPEKAVAKADVEKSKAQAEKAKADAEKSRAEADKAKAEAEKAKAEAETAKARAEAAKHQAAQQAVAKPAPAVAAAAPAAPAATPSKAAAAGDSVDAIHARLEKSLNGGRAADGTLSVANLQAGDTLYVDGPVRAVTRREGGRIALYWVDGDLDLRRSELRVAGPDRYQVVAAIRGEATLRRDAVAAASLDAREPAADAPTRLTLEKSLNDGRTITNTMTPDRLRNGDIIYSNENTAVVVRRSGNDLLRYWLVGSLDLTQVGLRADGANKYKVVADTVR